jgi:hypothetical protein
LKKTYKERDFVAIAFPPNDALRTPLGHDTFSTRFGTCENEEYSIPGKDHLATLFLRSTFSALLYVLNLRELRFPQRHDVLNCDNGYNIQYNSNPSSNPTFKCNVTLNCGPSLDFKRNPSFSSRFHTYTPLNSLPDSCTTLTVKTALRSANSNLACNFRGILYSDTPRNDGRLLRTSPKTLRALAIVLRQSSYLQFRSLIDLAVVDRLRTPSRFSVNYLFFSAPTNQRLLLQLFVDETSTIPSLSTPYTNGQRYFASAS